MSQVLLAGGGTGGHLYPALALAAALEEESGAIRVHFAGARRGVEARVLPSRGLPHTLLPLEPLRRDRIWRNWRLLPAMLRSFTGLRRLFRAFRPGLVVGTGGYVSGPACIWALQERIPVALQEQNSWPGFTTRLLARWARQIHLGFPEAAQHLRPGKRTQVFTLGNPIAPPDPSLDRHACRRDFGLQPDSVVVLVVGGSQGARAINGILLEALAGVHSGSLTPRPPGLEILWATGPSHLQRVQLTLAPLALDWVHLQGYIDPMPPALAAADVALSRAGAMTTAEFLAWGIPMVLVPLPTAAADHQTHNARALEAAGAARLLEESSLTAARLWDGLCALCTDEDARLGMAQAARARARPDAARAIARELLTLVEVDR